MAADRVTDAMVEAAWMAYDGDMAYFEINEGSMRAAITAALRAEAGAAGRREPAWIVLSPMGRAKSGAFPQKQAAVKEAIPGCMGQPEYNDLENDKARWKYLQLLGYKAVKVTIDYAALAQARRADRE